MKNIHISLLCIITIACSNIDIYAAQPLAGTVWGASKKETKRPGAGTLNDAHTPLVAALYKNPERKKPSKTKSDARINIVNELFQ